MKRNRVGHQFMRTRASKNIPLLSITFLLSCLVLISCGGGGGGGDSTPAPTPPAVNNEYRGTWTDTHNAANTGSWNLIFQQGGASVTGSVTVPQEGTYNFMGTVTSNTLVFRGTIGTEQFNGTGTINGNQFSGNCVSTSGYSYSYAGSLYSGNPLQPFGSTTVKFKTRDYYPLNNADDYDYSDGSYKTTVAATFLPYITEQVFKEDAHIKSGSSFILRSTFRKFDTSDNLLHYAVIWENGNYAILTPSAQILPAEMEVGKAYQFSHTRNEYTSSGTYHGSGGDTIWITITGPENVSVPAGNFTTYRVNIIDYWYDSWGGSGTEVTNYWLAKNVGPVKVEFTEESFHTILQLKTAFVNGVNYP